MALWYLVGTVHVDREALVYWRERGFTLIELLVAVAIVAILATVAVASYQEHIRRSARADAKSVLMEAAGWMERSYTTNGNYSAPLPATFSKSPRDGPTRYDISLANAAVVATDPPVTFPASGAQAYTLQAVPTGASAGDPCGTLLIDHTGRKGVTGADATVAECWQR